MFESGHYAPGFGAKGLFLAGLAVAAVSGCSSDEPAGAGTAQAVEASPTAIRKVVPGINSSAAPEASKEQFCAAARLHHDTIGQAGNDPKQQVTAYHKAVVDLTAMAPDDVQATMSQARATWADEAFDGTADPDVIQEALDAQSFTDADEWFQQNCSMPVFRQ